MRHQRAPSDEQLFPSLRGQGMIAVDCETWDPELKQKGPGWHRDDTYIAGVAIGTEAGFRQYYPIDHADGNMDHDKVIAYLKDELRHDEPKVGANLGYDVGYLHEYGVALGGPLWDVQNAEPLLNENKFTYSLESLSKQYLGVGKIDEELEEYIKRTWGKEARTNPKRFIAKCPAAVVAPYGIGDVNHPLEIFKRQRPELERQGLWHVFEMESKLIPLLHKMRRRAVRVDVRKAEEMLARMRGEQAVAEAEIKRITGVEVQVWSANSLKSAFDEIGMRYTLTPTGKPSFTKPYLERAAQHHDLPKLVLEVRRLDKMCGTFLEGCILDAHHQGRVYCQFNQQKSDDGGAVSGRFSSSNPNLQFIPERTDEGKLLRQIFIPDEGCNWYKADYSQIEFRLMVHDAAELNLPGAADIAQMYHDDPETDFHEVVAEIVYGADFTDVQRKRGKTINFGIAFGEGKDKLSQQLGVSTSEALGIIAEYHRKVPFMSRLAEGAMRLAAIDGQIETIKGRLRRFHWGKTTWHDDGTNTTVTFPHRVPGSKRVFTHKALNARIQGSAADIMKEAMVKLEESGVHTYMGVPHLTVHDELDYSTPDDNIGKDAMEYVKNVMENVFQLKVPLLVELEKGPNWGATKNLTERRRESSSEVVFPQREGGLPLAYEEAMRGRR